MTEGHSTYERTRKAVPRNRLCTPGTLLLSSICMHAITSSGTDFVHSRDTACDFPPPPAPSSVSWDRPMMSQQAQTPQPPAPTPEQTSLGVLPLAGKHAPYVLKTLNHQTPCNELDPCLVPLLQEQFSSSQRERGGEVGGERGSNIYSDGRRSAFGW